MSYLWSQVSGNSATVALNLNFNYYITPFVFMEVSSLFTGCSIIHVRSCLNSRLLRQYLNGIFIFRGNPEIREADKYNALDPSPMCIQIDNVLLSLA